MLGNISNESLISGNSINQNENINGVEKKEETKNPYAKTVDFDDSLEISEKAKELLQKEKEIEFFKSMVLDTPNSKEELNAILELIREGDVIDNKDLADAMQADQDLLSYLFGNVEAVS